MEYDTETQPQVVLTSVRNNEWLTNSLKRRRHQDDTQLLVSAANNIPVCLNYPGVKPIVDLDIDSASKCHRETRLIDVKVVDAEYRGQIGTIDVDLLNGDSE